MKKLNLNENFICRIWENDDYYKALKTKQGEEVVILDYGNRNKDAGPDYSDAKALINGKLKCGKIEIHQSSADWRKHNHQKDSNYDNVILNVSLWDDNSKDSIVNSKGNIIPEIILSHFLVSSIKEIWREIIETPSKSFKLPCFTDVAIVNPEKKKDWITQLSKDRLNKKIHRIKERLNEIKSNPTAIEQVLFEFLCESMGYSKNKKQMLKLAQSVDFVKIKVKNLLESQAVLFETSGLMDNAPEDDYIKEIKGLINLNVISTKMKPSEWNFFRLRPSNFPTLRIAYAAALLYQLKSCNFFESVIKIFENSKQIQKDLYSLFSSIETPDYWKRHYNFAKTKNKPSELIGNNRIDEVLINVLIPFVCFYARVKNNNRLEENCIDLYFRCKHRSTNSITRVMQLQTGIKIDSFSDEQGLIELHNEFCIKGRCNKCTIGIELTPGIVAEPLTLIMY